MTKMTGKIFISYRRADSSWAVRSLYDRLTTRFDHKQIFMDVDLNAGIDSLYCWTVPRCLGLGIFLMT
jgi:hypothetical protein